MCYPKDLIPETACVQLHMRRNEQPDVVADGVMAAAAVESSSDEIKNDKKTPFPQQRYVVSAPEPFVITPHSRPLISPKDDAGVGPEKPHVRPRHPIGPTDDRCMPSHTEKKKILPLEKNSDLIYMFLYLFCRRILVWEMRRPGLTDDEVQHLFGPLPSSDKHDAEMSDETLEVLKNASESDKSAAAASFKTFAESLLQIIPPQNPIESVLPPVCASPSDQDAATLEWCRSRLAELQDHRAHILAHITKLLPAMNAAVVECRYTCIIILIDFLTSTFRVMIMMCFVRCRFSRLCRF
jgi:hypothetical protein